MRPQRLIPAILYVAALTACYLWMAGAADTLPARVATHFDGAGQADGWTPRDRVLPSFLYLTVGLSLLLPVLMTLLRFCPARFLNVPNAGYWRQPEPYRQARNFLYDWSWWCALLTVGFCAGLFALTLDANAAKPPVLTGNGLALLTAAYVAGIIAWTIGLVVFFSRNPEPPTPGSTP
ncbi:MAG TPA: DUF1648 domain-containing protein [Terrimicrobiaceae bacterium]|nr:DUF1648 domain-containing protein [Terrimicrobiaceae bacterium]